MPTAATFNKVEKFGAEDGTPIAACRQPLLISSQAANWTSSEIHLLQIFLPSAVLMRFEAHDTGGNNPSSLVDISLADTHLADAVGKAHVSVSRLKPKACFFGTFSTVGCHRREQKHCDGQRKNFRSHDYASLDSSPKAPISHNNKRTTGK
jgi:hypothetical protein